MHHVIGIGDDTKPNLRPLLPQRQFRFDTNNDHTLGYFSLIAPPFDHFAVRDAGISIFSINVMFALTPNDLLECQKILMELEKLLSTYPASWRSSLGRQIVGKERLRREIEPILKKPRALSIVCMLQDLVQSAITSNQTLLFGNGVDYRALCGIKLPPGVVEYS
jgi:hypothetical protein